MEREQSMLWALPGYSVGGGDDSLGGTGAPVSGEELMPVVLAVGEGSGIVVLF